jgi:pimeloyl-ACP methyl ester carboxylesterase
MVDPKRRHVDDLRGASRLAVEATRAVTDLVQEMHVVIAGGPDLLGRPLEGPARALTGLVYGSIRGVTSLVGSSIDLALERLAPLLGESAPGPEREAVLAVLNGVLGDYLQETGNPLAIRMHLRRGGRTLDVEREALRSAIPEAGGKLLVMTHGSSMNDLGWNRGGRDHGAALARDLGYTPVYLHYNTGLHISANGRELAALLEKLVAEWPVPSPELSIVAHSMGGLVARSACHYGDEASHAWRRALKSLVCLGSPHHGAPLERGGNWIDVLLGVSRYSAPLAKLGRIRSAGVTDLRFGSVLDEHWEGRDRFAKTSDPRRRLELPAGVRCYAIAGTLAEKEPRKRLHSLPGDGIVPVDSALGRHAKAELTLDFPEAHRWIALGTGHLELLSRPEVYEKIRGWLS